MIVIRSPSIRRAGLRREELADGLAVPAAELDPLEELRQHDVAVLDAPAEVGAPLGHLAGVLVHGEVLLLTDRLAGDHLADAVALGAEEPRALDVLLRVGLIPT